MCSTERRGEIELEKRGVVEHYLRDERRRNDNTLSSFVYSFIYCAATLLFMCSTQLATINKTWNTYLSDQLSYMFSYFYCILQNLIIAIVLYVLIHIQIEPDLNV